jgi:hypothetical protein
MALDKPLGGPAHDAFVRETEVSGQPCDVHFTHSLGGEALHTKALPLEMSDEDEGNPMLRDAWMYGDAGSP